jgi:hypothetical protein
VSRNNPDPASGATVLAGWRQGDVVTTPVPVAAPHWTKGRPSRVARLRRLLSRSRPSALPAHREWVVITQTCDLVRPASTRPYLQLAPVIRLGGDELVMAQKHHTPRHVAVPQAGPDAFADLDEVLTVEKTRAAGFQVGGSLPGADAERAFSEAIARHYGRPALPDELNEALAKLKDLMVKRHGKLSPEGSAVTALLEIRVSAAPSWDSPQVRVVLYFIHPEEPRVGIDGKTLLDEAAWERWITSWGDLFEARGTLREYVALPITYGEMDALTYRSTDILDLEHLSA